MKRIGILTSGGDSPGMNAAVVAAARSAALYDMEVIGIKRGYNGLVRGNDNTLNDSIHLDMETILDIADQPGTFLRTARCIEFLNPDVRKKAVERLVATNIEGLIVIGGDGTFKGAREICDMGIPCVCIPGTIDNDLAYTEYTMGYDTAVNICVNAVRMIRATSRSHDRVAVVEVMGRHCGDLALRTAVCTGAEIVIVPEIPWNVYQIAERISYMMEKGDTRATVIVAEGVFKNQSMEPFNAFEMLSSYDAGYHKTHSPNEPMSSTMLANVLRFMCPGCDARATVLGYIQRGSPPYAYDAAFAFEAGYLAAKLLNSGVSEQVIGMRNGKIFYMPIRDALQIKLSFDTATYNLINSL